MGKSSEGTAIVRFQLGMGASTVLHVSFITSEPLAYVFILGMDGIRKLGGITVTAHCDVYSDVKESVVCGAGTAPDINDRDFCY